MHKYIIQKIIVDWWSQTEYKNKRLFNVPKHINNQAI